MESVLLELRHLVSMLVAVLLGFAIGYERKLRYKEAGIRTHTICMRLRSGRMKFDRTILLILTSWMQVNPFIRK